jgi:CubicO group peptidase (beta-lactamase class C family)
MRPTPVFLLALTIAGPAVAQRPADRVLDKAFDARVDSVMKQWKVPGIGIAVVKGNQVILAKGYGFKNVDQKDPVTKDTKFAIGSVTKSFAVTGLASQASEGKLEWDVPVRRYLPDFQMFDPVATERMTPRDLVIHRSGLPRHDLMWGGGTYTREEIYQRLRYLEPSRDFRAVWQYQNLMYMTAGYLSGKLDGTSWEEVVKNRVFRPLGMATADFSVADLQRSADYAFPYARLPNDSVVKIPYRNLDAIGPAGSINASPAEMIRYVTMHLNRGRFEGREILKPSAAAEMQNPQMVMPTPNDPGPGGVELGHQQYGMGFFVGSYRGRKMVHHGGNIDGFSAEVSFLPNDSIGVVVLTNLNGTPTRDFIPFMIYDRLLGLPAIDWSGRYQAQADRQRARQDSIRAADVASRVANTQPSRGLADFAGSYSHPGYGLVRIGTANGKLTLNYSSFAVDMDHVHYDVFETKPRSAAQPIRWKVQFLTDAAGTVTGLSFPAEPALKPMVFARQKP